MANFTKVGSNYLLSNLDVSISTLNRILYVNSSGNITGVTPSDLGLGDTKVTNTLATTTKAYVTGTTSGSTNTGTQVFDTNVYLDSVAGRFRVNELNIADKAYLSWDSTNSAIKVSFA